MEIDKKLLQKQIKDLLESNIPEESKTGLHNLLGAILDSCDKQRIVIELSEGFEDKYLINEMFRLIAGQYLSGAVAGSFEITDKIVIKWKFGGI